MRETHRLVLLAALALASCRATVDDGRPRRAEQVEVGIAQVVECPISRHDHRVAVALAEHTAGCLCRLAEYVEPEDEVFDPHPVRDCGLLGTSRSFAEPPHRTSNLVRFRDASRDDAVIDRGKPANE